MARETMRECCLSAAKSVSLNSSGNACKLPQICVKNPDDTICLNFTAFTHYVVAGATMGDETRRPARLSVAQSAAFDRVVALLVTPSWCRSDVGFTVPLLISADSVRCCFCRPRDLRFPHTATFGPLVSVIYSEFT